MLSVAIHLKPQRPQRNWRLIVRCMMLQIARLWAPFSCVALWILAAPDAGHGKTPVELLREMKPPQFRKGHTLPPLTRWGWTLDYDVRVELCEHWGYALEF